ncbi:MAG: hypothetical protein AB1782_14950 [Cyanobacteriota bacterium]
MNEDDKKANTIRWYDRDGIVAKSMNLLQEIPDDLKRQVASYLVDDIINRKPYCDMFPIDTHYMILSEQRRRRWYDFDETIHIFVELLRHASEAQRVAISQMVIDFIETLIETDRIARNEK